MKLRFVLLVVLWMGVGLPLPANAVLVEDPTEWAKTMMVYHKLEAELAQLQDEYRELKLLKADAEGHYGYGGLLNGASDLTAREWSPSNWQDALKGLSGDNPSRYQQLLQAYQAAHPTLSQRAFTHGASAEAAKNYRQEVHTNEAASVNATYAFNNVEQRLRAIYALSKNIDHAQNTKAAIDLNSRLLTEVAYINVQQVKMQALLNEQMAQSAASRIESETQEAKFNTIPK